jgi:hypothetical protein
MPGGGGGGLKVKEYVGVTVTLKSIVHQKYLQ